MSAIATYVFFDIETTGLPNQENYQTKITEISFLAVKRKHFLQTRKGSEPRVQQKLTLCLNPERKVQPGSTQVTGLSNDLLELEPCFDMEVFKVIKRFFGLLTKPICLIAHNGHGFDFPILKYQLETLDVNLAEDIMCADSIYGFFDILEGGKKNDDSSSVVNREIEEPHIFSDNNHNNESKSKRMKRTHQEAMICPLPISRARRAIFWKNEAWKGETKPDQSYKLTDIYHRLFNLAPEDAHRAESDCLLVLKCSLKLGEAFVQWVDKNHCLFSEVIPMRPGRRLGF